MKKVLPVAVLAAMAGVNGAQAVHVNPDGLGQVLLYPYFTTTEGQDTYINLVNTTNQYKAVKVRILESLNSQEVLDFNLYLSPQDHWSATITADPDGEGGALFSMDNSCTVPLAVSNGDTIPFRDFEYSNDFDKDGEPWGLERTREGYVEVLEMGQVVNGSQNWPADILHDSNGIPGDCADLDASWNGGVWDTNQLDGILAPTGGLYGYGVLINVDEGTDATYDALALENFFDSLFHTDPGSLFPGLADSTPLFDVIEGNQVISGFGSRGGFEGLDAVSALITHDTVSNDYVLEPSIDAGTDWVITFPTKEDYVAVSPAIAPFLEPWDSGLPEPRGLNSTSCEEFGFEYWDREEKAPQVITNNDFSPRPPTDPDTFALCAEANVLSFNESNVLGAPQTRNGTNFDLESGFDNGWARMDFVDPAGRPPLPVQDLNSNPLFFEGLPVIGFAVQKYVNGDVGGLLSNYVGNVTHKATRSVSGSTSP